MMSMNTETKRLMADSIRDFHMPRFGELPDMGLYLEQVVKYINTALAPLECLELTPSMVSNYVKKGIIGKPVKKQYYAEHIAYLFFTVLAKNMASIEDIGLLMDLQKKSYPLPLSYNYLCDELENMLFFVFGLKGKPDDLGETDSDERCLLRNLVFSAAHIIHMHACFKRIRSGEA